MTPLLKGMAGEVGWPTSRVEGPAMGMRRSAGLSRRDGLWGLALAAAIEAVTCLLRFGLGLQSTRDTRALGHFTFGLRVHHGYLGLLLVVAAVVASGRQSVRRWAFRIGLALVLSDLVHHLVVLWIATGRPHFDLFYPP